MRPLHPQPVALDDAVEAWASDPQLSGGFSLVAPAPIQHGLDVSGLGSREGVSHRAGRAGLTRTVRAGPFANTSPKIT